ncbi:hypothetical protein SAMN05216353_10947 [Halobacillus alkaliphilus]|uniref:Outer membrane lipoprotein-sorting protein n=1 Tax=Halobacillus alkaliphilus TaxID=396056 RepID=A0A1I2LNZ9_9BACI|nr:hypothetical protein [Halobacillus alkaliphilus]SFF79137.1 hypothetical protein SAMN05216353_10947 [Halobacillus alkaliphilus]
MRLSIFIRFISITMMFMWVLSGCGGSDSTDEKENNDQAVEEASGEEMDEENSTEEVSEVTNTNANSSEGEGSESKETEAEWDVSKLQQIKGFTDIMDKFSLISYSFNSPGSSLKITMQRVGEEEVNGELTNHIKVNMEEDGGSGEAIELWVTSEGETKRMVAGGERMEGEMLQMAGQSYVMMLLMPFNMTDRTEVTNILKNQTEYPGVKVSKLSKDQKTIGDVKMDTYTYEVTSEGEKSTWEVGDLGDYQVMTSWKVQQEEGDASFQISDLELRR